jgi:hypothetical protein
MRVYRSKWIERNVYYRLKPGGDPTYPHYEQYERPVVVCLCGSTRFYDEFQAANYRETMAGKVVLSVGFAGRLQRQLVTVDGCMGPQECEVLTVRSGESVGCTPEQKVALDVLHCQKIDLADEVLVLNVGGYVGDSTRREVLHAARRYKVVRWLEPHSVPTDLAHLGDSQCGGPLVHRDGV